MTRPPSPRTRRLRLVRAGACLALLALLAAGPARADEADAPDPHAWMVPTGWTLVGVGAATEVGGWILFLLNFEAELRGFTVAFTGPSTSASLAQVQAAEARGIAGDIAVSVGGALLAGGVAIELGHALTKDSGTRVRVSAGPGGARLALSF